MCTVLYCTLLYCSIHVHVLSFIVHVYPVAEVIDEYTGKGTDAVSSSVGELCPLFFQPGKTGFYSIRVGSHTPARINAYRNIGR